jgi:hypothetical protein
VQRVDSIHVKGKVIETHAPQRGFAPVLTGGTGWPNSTPLTPGKLRGHVVLYVFCTYTCINWLRTLPYVRAWDARYGDHSLVVVGIHTPEFAFEEDMGNVRRAADSQHIQFSVVLDSHYELWRSFDNHYWPALYLADHHGVIRYEHFGEGRYETPSARSSSCFSKQAPRSARISSR